MQNTKPESEGHFQKRVTAWLKRNNIIYYKTTGGIMRNAKGSIYVMNKGFPDLELFQNGKITFWELKTNSGRLRDSQKEMFKKLNDENIEVFVLRPDDWEKVKGGYIKNGNIDYVSMTELKTWKEES